MIGQDQHNILVCRPDLPYFKQKQKNITKFWQIDFFKIIIFCFFLIKEIEQQTYINNQNQEAFIVIIINYKLRVFPLCLVCKILLSKKYRSSESNNIIFILPTDTIVFCCLACGLKN